MYSIFNYKNAIQSKSTVVLCAGPSITKYKSEIIEDEPYLLSVIRYIHNNPEKAGIAKKEKYKCFLHMFINLLTFPDQA